MTRPLGVTTYSLALNYLPLAQLAAGALVASQAGSPGTALAVALAWIYLLPPLTCRLATLIFGAPYGRDLTQQTRSYRLWWFLCQWQIVFNRLPWLEEVLRLVPGLYAFWIFLWGGRISSMAYWAPGSMIVDRSLVIVEAGAVMGMGACLAGHAARLHPDGSFTVDIAPPKVGRGAMLGAFSVLGPGAELPPYQLLPAGRMIKPFGRWDASPYSRKVEGADGGES